MTAACSSTTDSKPSTEELPPIVALYGDKAETELSPYPSDRYLVDGHVDIPETSPDLLNVPGGEETVAELEAMNGFSTSGGVIVTFDGPVDVSTISLLPDQLPDQAEPLRDASAYTEEGSPLYLLDVARGELVGLIPRYWEQQKDDYYIQDEYTIIAMPAVPLRPGAEYLFVVSDALRAQTGGKTLRSPDMDTLLAADDAYATQVNAGIDALTGVVAIRREQIVLATSFTTATVHDELLVLADAVRAQPTPALSEAWTVDRDEDPRARLRAVFETDEYRKPSPDSRFEIDADGVAQPQGQNGLEVFVDVSDKMSSAPRTVVIYGHGLGGDKDGSWGTALRLADINAAVFAIDSPHHGTRASGGGAESIFSFFGIEISDQSSFVIGRARDNFRQMAIDQLQLVRLIGSLSTLDMLPPGAPDGVPDFDTSRIFYIGHSFGSVQGPTVFALAPEITHAVWNVGGAGLMMLLRDSGTFSLLVNSLAPDGIASGAVARFMAVTQAIVDPGDALNYAPFALREEPPAPDGAMGVPGWVPREVLLQEVIADSIVPNSTSRALARAAGLQLIDAIEPVSGLPAASGPVTANLPEGVTGAMSQFDRINDGDVAVHGELIFAPEGIAQYLEFFSTALTSEHATIPPAY